jgi:hypothetical protein
MSAESGQSGGLALPERLTFRVLANGAARRSVTLRHVYVNNVERNG